MGIVILNGLDPSKLDLLYKIDTDGCTMKKGLQSLQYTPFVPSWPSRNLMLGVLIFGSNMKFGLASDRGDGCL